MIKYYVIVVEGGNTIYSYGPFNSEQSRDRKAKKLWKELDAFDGDAIFRAYVGKDQRLYVSEFIWDELDK